jgi:hypothetical protein
MDEPLTNLLFEYPGADVILRSHDTHHFQVLKSYIINNSPVLDELIRKAIGPPDDTHDVASLPVVQLPENGAILHSLLTFVFPVIPLLPSTTDQSMELLSVAQKYQMESVLALIRLSIARHSPPSAQRDSTLHMYYLAHKYGLRQEALQAARTILHYPLNIESLEDRFGTMSGASLYELWKYSGKVRPILASDLEEFRTSGAHGILTGLSCVELSSSQIPRWLDDYIASIRNAPNLFDIFEFTTTRARHVSQFQNDGCPCGSISSQTIRSFWEALASVLDGSFEKVSVIDVNELPTRLMIFQAESALSLVREREDIQAEVNSTMSVCEALDLPDANLIVQSSDLVNFRVHKSVLAITSPVFKDMFSHEQPPESGSESVDGLPVVKLTEDAVLLKTLFSILYPVRLVIPDSYEKVLYLLAACQKYAMDQAQSFIRAEVSCGVFPAPTGAEVFGAYAIANGKRLVPEMESAACRTLDYPMTLETLGKGLQSFEGSALQDLARFRKRCTDDLVTCLKSFLNLRDPPFNIWMSCRDLSSYSHSSRQTTAGFSPPWLTSFFQQLLTELDHAFTKPLPNSSNIRDRYTSALQAHTISSGNISCINCVVVHAMRGETFCEELENRLALCISRTKMRSAASRQRIICNPRNLTPLSEMVASKEVSKKKKSRKGKKK